MFKKILNMFYKAVHVQLTDFQDSWKQLVAVC